MSLQFQYYLCDSLYKLKKVLQKTYSEIVFPSDVTGSQNHDGDNFNNNEGLLTNPKKENFSNAKENYER